MNRAYDEISGKANEKKYLCPWKMFAGNEDLVIAVNDWAKRLHFTLEDQKKYCDIECPSKNECKANEKKDVIDIFSPVPKKPETSRPRFGGRSKGVMEVDGIIVEDDEEEGRKTIGDSNATR